LKKRFNKKEVFRQILSPNFRKGDYVKFKWGDLRRRKGWQVRKTWCYGKILYLLSDDDYIVRLIKGGQGREFRVSLNEKIQPWCPRKYKA